MNTTPQASGTFQALHPHSHLQSAAHRGPFQPQLECRACSSHGHSRAFWAISDCFFLLASACGRAGVQVAVPFCLISFDTWGNPTGLTQLQRQLLLPADPVNTRALWCVGTSRPPVQKVLSGSSILRYFCFMTNGTCHSWTVSIRVM